MENKLALIEQHLEAIKAAEKAKIDAECELEKIRWRLEYGERIDGYKTQAGQSNRDWLKANLDISDWEEEAVDECVNFLDLGKVSVADICAFIKKRNGFIYDAKPPNRNDIRKKIKTGVFREIKTTGTKFYADPKSVIFQLCQDPEKQNKDG